MADVPVLACTAGRLAGTVFRVPEQGLHIGRSDDNNIVLDEDGVSRFHASFQYDNGSLWLQDAGSRNGLFVDDKRVSGHKALKVGNVIKIGEHLFEVRWEESTETETEEMQPPQKKWYWPFG
jgi:pSer/pThr/pTyr-binding forkhead associated (FHA) protein